LIDEVAVIYSVNSDIYSEADIDLIKNTIENIGMISDIVQIDENLNKYIEKNRAKLKLIFNLVLVVEDRFSRFLPAICELLKIPYVGAGIFTNSMLDGDFSKEILQYHNILYSEKLMSNTHQISLIGNKEKIISSIVKLEADNGISKDASMDAEIQKKLIKDTLELKSSLKIHDYFSISGVFKPKQKSKFIIQEIAPSPALKESSPFCESFKTLGMSYEEIIAGILISAMNRYKIALPEKFEVLSDKIFD
jgi:D-alanine-D-alanine ligase-like ATP-grasp enzyme